MNNDPRLHLSRIADGLDYDANMEQNSNYHYDAEDVRAAEYVLAAIWETRDSHLGPYALLPLSVQMVVNRLMGPDISPPRAMVDPALDADPFGRTADANAATGPQR